MVLRHVFKNLITSLLCDMLLTHLFYFLTHLDLVSAILSRSPAITDLSLGAGGACCPLFLASWVASAEKAVF
jgi:hypothetical protein